MVTSYTQIKYPDGSTCLTVIKRLSDAAFIPFDPANNDYQKFKKDIMDGGELQDADGDVMTPEAAQEFIRSLP